MVKVIMSYKTKQILVHGNGAKFVDNAIKRSFEQIGRLIVKDTARGIKNGPKTGRIYGNHRASRGKIEYPANKTGNLRRSLNYRISGREKMMIGMEATYATYLEEGTATMEKRKLLGFTIGVNRNPIRKIFRDNINSEFKS